MKVVTVIGARPQFIKAAPVSKAFAAHPGVREVLVHTGQHYDDDMSSRFFEELDLPSPDYRLAAGNRSHGAMTGHMLEEIERILVAERPDVVLVYGDTNSTLAGTLAAVKLQIPVAHVEAGLRSFNRRMPEEINRVLTDAVSELLFCPTASAAEQLKSESVVGRAFVVGDVMYDAVLQFGQVAEERSDILDRLALTPGAYAVATVHRAANTDSKEALSRVVDYLESEARATAIVMPAHPRTKSRMQEFGLSFRNVRTIPPLGYLDIHKLVGNASMVFTDSGGLQKEALFHRVPCVTMRDETEWTETVEAGWNRLWSSPSYAPRREVEAFGRGDAAIRIVGEVIAFADARTTGP